MNSEKKTTKFLRPGRIAAVIVAALLVLLSGCTEELSIDAVFTDDTNWAPSIHLVNNGYQRIEVTIGPPPRKELLRNINMYLVETKAAVASSFSPLDTIQGSTIPPSYLIPTHPFMHRTGSSFEYAATYTVRVAVKYRDGSANRSNEISFTPPPIRGAVLRRLPLPLKVPADTYWFGNFLAFSTGGLLVLRDEQLFRVDTASGRSTILSSRFLPPEDYQNKTFRTMAVCDDMLIAWYQNRFANVIKLVRLNLTTLVVDSSLALPLQGYGPQALVGHGSNLMVVWSLPSDSVKIGLYDPRNGSLLKEYPTVRITIPYPYSISSDGANLWFSRISSFDNRIVGSDPSTGSLVGQYHNPIFSPEGLAWDGSHFSLIDNDSNSIAKLELGSL